MKEILAMPSLSDSTDFGLSNLATNKKRAEELLSKKPIKVFEVDGVSIFKVGDRNQGNLFTIEDERQLISYFVHYKVLNKKILGESVTQTALWRSLDSFVPSGLTRKVVFGYLLKEYPIILSDRIQTEDGRDFWMTLMTQALHDNYKVSLVDFNMRKVHIIEHQAELRIWYHSTAEEGNAWDWYSNKHEGLRFAIYRK